MNNNDKVVKRLTAALKKIEQGFDEVNRTVEEAIKLQDVNLVDVFKDVYKSPLIDAADMIRTLAPKLADHVETLALVLYVKDMESTGLVSGWRELVGKSPVEAIRTLRTVIPKLSVGEARMVIDAYKLNPF